MINFEGRQVLVSHLRGFFHNYTQRNEPWLMIGDFNQIQNNNEKLGGHLRDESSFVDFKNMLQACEMSELKYIGNKFSWSDQRSVVRNGLREKELIQCCLDKSFANSEWLSVYPASEGEFLEPIKSDHHPLIVKIMSTTPVKRGLFRYDKRLWEKEGFKEEIKQEWDSLPFQSSVSSKITSLRKSISRWKRKHLTNSTVEIDLLKKDLET